MITLITILVTALIIFMIVSMLISSGETDLDKQKADREKKENEFQGADPKKVYNKKWDPNIPRPRICPACGTALKREEFLYASIDDNVPPGTRRPVHIYGCKYCYLGIQKDTSIQENLDI
ncbi:MAG: hypothetical protein H7A24_07125 [Leptospiraceae bacterium]|nr:hypothetical protein [Leptospiraceae bacterium]MCP5511636.1 hypothetical protein [Leptospiraceae bacterium]